MHDDVIKIDPLLS